MRSRPGQGAREALRGQHGVPRQPWPLILLGLAVGAHGLLPPTAAPRNTAPSMEAPAGKSPWSLWDRPRKGAAWLDCEKRCRRNTQRPDSEARSGRAGPSQPSTPLPRRTDAASPSALRSQWWPGQPLSEGDTLGDSKACEAAASARGLGRGTPPGHEPTQACPGLQRAGSTPPLSPRTQPQRLQPCACHAQQVPAWRSPPGGRPQVLARRVLVRGSVTVFCLRRRDPAHRPESAQVRTLGHSVPALQG